MIRARLAVLSAFMALMGGKTLAETANTQPPPEPQTKLLQTLRDIGPAVGRCWRPPSIKGVGEITVQLSFRRDGAINGLPRISYSHAVDATTRAELIGSLAAALAQCGPLPVSPSLGAAIAGRMFAIRFIIVDQKGAHDI
jgi:hypothetical protein